MSRIYRTIISIADKFVPNALRPLWEHPAGPKTIFFWAPLGKWSLVIAGLGDINRPVEKLSVRQSGSLALTGTIWARWSLIIIPKNYSLFAVNCFVATTGIYQLTRALVLASLDAYTRPLDKVSTTQSATLSATGLIWTRYCLVITPVNYSLAVCNFALGVANGVQTVRAYMYQRQKAIA